MPQYSTQQTLLLKNLMNFYSLENDNLDTMLNIINGESNISTQDSGLVCYELCKATIYCL